jgi:hypothetical protein
LVATAAVTDSIGSGWFADEAASFLRLVYFHAARLPPRSSTMATRTMDPTQPRELLITTRGLQTLSY